MIAHDSSLARLMALAQAGDRTAYATLLEESRKWLTRYFARRVQPHQLDDLVQDTLLSLHLKRASYDPQRPFLPWLAVIGRNRWLDHLRKLYRQREDELDEAQAGIDSEPEISARLSIDRLLDLLPAGQRQAIRLVKIEGQSIEEAATASGQSASLVKVNIHRGIKRLARLIESE